MIPYLPVETRREAAKRSLELRRERADIKLRLSRQRNMSDVWDMPAAQGMKVFDLLCALPGIGRAKALSLLKQADIPEKNTVRACGPKQTERLFALLTERG